MHAADTQPDVTLWMVDDTPSRMFYAGRRWRVTDIPTRLRESIWTTAPDRSGAMYGWRFQATDEDGQTFVFDVFRTSSDWHVHRTYC